MIKQKPISLKIYYELFAELEWESSLGYHSRNWHINQAIRLYISYKDTFRKIGSYGYLSEKREELQSFIQEWFPNMPD